MPQRCFVAATLTPAPLALISEAGRRFLNEAPDWAREKWVRPEVTHLTLKFAGPLPDSDVDEILAALAAECANHPPFDLRLAGVRAVPASSRARMLWATLDGQTAACSDLARSISLVLERRFGVAESDHPFAPHITLVRARSARPVDPVAVAAATTALASGKETDRNLSVRYVTLFASTLGPAGPVHDVLGKVPLGG
jgi:2'-5' RNA ligase